LKTEEIKNTANTAAKAAIELYENRKDTYDALKGTKQQAGTCKKLSKCGNQSLLIKAGLALVVFPEPIISDLLGTSLIAAGAIQQGIKRQSIYIDDLPKALKSAIEEVKASKELI
jgi:hypothetical protein